MLDFLRDPVWQFIGAAIGLAALILAGVALRKQFQRTALSYQRIATTPLLSVQDELKGKLEIRYDGRTVEQVHLVLIKIMNNGDLPIRATDFEQPLALGFGDPPTKILSAEVVGRSTLDLQPGLTIEPTAPVLSMEPVLFNPSDWVTLKVLVSQFSDVVIARGRIVGVASISDYDAYTPIGTYLTRAGSVLVLVGIFGIWIASALSGPRSTAADVFTLVFILSIALYSIALVVDRSVRRDLLRNIVKIYFFWLKG